MIASNNEATGLTTEFSYDAAGRQLESVESNGGLSRTQSSRFDVSGRVVEKNESRGIENDVSVRSGKKQRLPIPGELSESLKPIWTAGLRRSGDLR